MSLASWKEKYYPKEAVEATKSAVIAIRHSLKKWQGLSPEILREHKLERMQREVYELDNGGGIMWAECMTINTSTCALCLKYRKPGYDNPCSRCPIKRYNGIVCDGFHSAYWKFLNEGDNEPMVELLKVALRGELKRLRKRKAKVASAR